VIEAGRTFCLEGWIINKSVTRAIPLEC